MKLLCIKSRIGPRVSVYAGKIYTREDTVVCSGCGFAWYGLVEIPRVLSRPKGGKCHRCETLLPPQVKPFYRHYRFIPWRPDELGVTTEEANKLYDITPEKEKQDAKA